MKRFIFFNITDLPQDFNLSANGCSLGGQYFAPGFSWYPYIPPNGFATCTVCQCDVNKFYSFITHSHEALENLLIVTNSYIITQKIMHSSSYYCGKQITKKLATISIS